MSKKKILLVASSSYSLINFRGDFIKSLIENKYEVFTAAPNYLDNTLTELKSYGVTSLEYKLQRTGLNPFKDLQVIYNLVNIIKSNKIDLVFPYTIKPVIYSSIAANICKVKAISLITGLGFTFTGLTLKSRILQRLNEVLYKISIRKNRLVIFQNSDDYQLFIDRGILTKKNKVDFVNGSGVNLNLFKYRVNDNSSEVVSFVLVARMIMEKGIGLFIEAANILKRKYPKVEFHLIGSHETSPSAIKLEVLKDLNAKGIIVYHGAQGDIQEHLQKRDVFVLPTYYREGIPRSILEALSVGLPIITTNSPGCKETVLDGKNGILIKPQSLDELINAMEFFILNRDKIKEMGIESRKYAVNKFDNNIINKKLVGLIGKEF